MDRNLNRLALVIALSFSVMLIACGPSEEEQSAEARAEAWANLQARQTTLLEKRAKLAEMQDQIALGVEGMPESEDGMSPEEALLNLQKESDAFAEETAGEAEVFQTDLVNYINEDPMYRGEEPTESQLAALRMKTTEDIYLAREYVEKGGDYRRAQDILERAAQVDKDNPELQAEIELVGEMRFVTEERFASVEKGQTQPEVKALLGTVFHRNIREYPEQKALAWFYPKEDGGAAAVFFRKRGNQWQVYELDFDAVDASAQTDS